MDDLNVKNQPALKQFVPTPPRPPRKSERGILGTIRHRCFNSIGNSLLTLCVATMLFYLVKHVLDWAVFNAVFIADNRRQCMDISPDGACWAGVISWFNGLIYGRFPIDEQWRAQYRRLARIGLVITADVEAYSITQLCLAVLDWLVSFCGRLSFLRRPFWRGIRLGTWRDDVFGLGIFGHPLR
ncbi:hypothetical protein N5P32_06400 [Marinomonas pontica]|uniref:hypothetical protein n=1 Tax=Marinomonas pontica TaxID=264739 RepID=UPI002243A4FA|nr:hypothetical protein [Marinomonas pontica]MCW8355537.1 hypothetical protein [Marinomonas pontica]